MQPHDLLARVVEHLPLGVFAFSGDGQVLLWNSRAERLTGWDRARVVRDGLGGLPLDTPTARRIRDELLAGRPFRGRIPADVQADATLYFRAEPLPDPQGPLLVGVLQEVDDTRAGDEAFALLDALWETAPVGLAFFDSELRYRRVNGAILDTDGGTVEERLGRTLEAVHGPVGAEIAAGLREVLADGRSRFDVPVRGRLWHGRGPLQEWWSWRRGRPSRGAEHRRLQATDLEVGGDWYDAFALPDGDLAVGVGDVAGHDLSAAATMGQLRSMLRALAYEAGGGIHAAPSDVVCRLDRVATRLDVTGFTTLLFGRVCRRAGRTVFRWANAGHPPPVLVPAGGEPELLRDGVGVVLGVAPDRPRTDCEVELLPGATLLLYTDGLVERRNDPDDTASAFLLDLVRRGKELPLSDLCDHLVRGTGADTGDDMVVLALRVSA